MRGKKSILQIPIFGHAGTFCKGVFLACIQGWILLVKQVHVNNKKAFKNWPLWATDSQGDWGVRDSAGDIF